jgi:hypothetical protein
MIRWLRSPRNEAHLRVRASGPTTSCT